MYDESIVTGLHFLKFMIFFPNRNGGTIFEVPVVCDGEMLKQERLDSRLEGMSAEEQSTAFPFELARQKSKESGVCDLPTPNIDDKLIEYGFMPYRLYFSHITSGRQTDNLWPMTGLSS